jgi:HlyD family secretion protein
MKGKSIFFVIGILVVAALAVAYYINQNAQNAEGQYQTVVAEKGDLLAIVGATGTVRARQSAQLTWQTTGTVETVKVKLGDSVSANQELASLGMASVSQNIILAQSDLLNAQRSLEDLQTSNVARAQAEQALVTAQKAYDDAKTKYDGINFQRASDSYIKNTKAELDLAKQQVTLARRYYKLVENLNDGDSRKAQGLANLTAAELRVDQLTAQLNYVTGRPDEAEIAQRKSALDVATAQLEDAKRKLERIKDGPDPLDVATLETRIIAAQATINQVYVTAPFDGVITLVKPLPGDQVTPGTVAFRLDDLSHLLVDVQVSEIDINNIRVGQTVTMSFDAVLGRNYEGVVVEVSQAGSVVQGAVNFTVTVELTDADESVKPGMTAAVNILVKEVKNVLVVPNRAVRVIDGQRVVYVLKNGIPEMVKIRLGATSDTVSEVINGDLKEGDLIVLNPPAMFGGPMGGGRPGGN